MTTPVVIPSVQVRAALFDGLVEAARINAKLYGRPIVLDTTIDGTDEFESWPYDAEVYPPSGYTLSRVLGLDTDDQRLYVWPSGLAVGPDRVNWVWDFREARRGPSYYLGFARQAEQQARRLKVPSDKVVGVPGYMIHGTCVFEPGPRFAESPRDWRMVQAVSFPA